MRGEELPIASINQRGVAGDPHRRCANAPAATDRRGPRLVALTVKIDAQRGPTAQTLKLRSRKRRGSGERRRAS
jgi:hypothetical protein